MQKMKNIYESGATDVEIFLKFRNILTLSGSEITHARQLVARVNSNQVCARPKKLFRATLTARLCHQFHESRRCDVMVVVVTALVFRSEGRWFEA